MLLYRDLNITHICHLCLFSMLFAVRLMVTRATSCDTLQGVEIPSPGRGPPWWPPDGVSGQVEEWHGSGERVMAAFSSSFFSFCCWTVFNMSIYDHSRVGVNPVQVNMLNSCLCNRFRSSSVFPDTIRSPHPWCLHCKGSCVSCLVLEQMCLFTCFHCCSSSLNVYKSWEF